MSELERYAVLGGTFDPFHRGHLEPLVAASPLMGWSRILYVPAATQPFKQGRATTSGYHRYAMAVLATNDTPQTSVLITELERGGVSYTVETLEALRKTYPHAALDWVVGDDNLALLPEWKSLERIFELANFTVLSREASDLPPQLLPRVSTAERRGRSGSIVFAGNAPLRISATAIRGRVGRGESIDDLVDGRVARYIRRNALYQKED